MRRMGVAIGIRPERIADCKRLPRQTAQKVMASRIRPERIADCKRLHAAAWPAVLVRIAGSNIRNYTIFLREPENLLFGYREYHGADFAADPATQDWRKLCGPRQAPPESRAQGEWRAAMEEIFHTDLPEEEEPDGQT